MVTVSPRQDPRVPNHLCALSLAGPSIAIVAGLERAQGPSSLASRRLPRMDPFTDQALTVAQEEVFGYCSEYSIQFSGTANPCTWDLAPAPGT